MKGGGLQRSLGKLRDFNRRPDLRNLTPTLHQDDRHLTVCNAAQSSLLSQFENAHDYLHVNPLIALQGASNFRDLGRLPDPQTDVNVCGGAKCFALTIWVA